MTPRFFRNNHMILAGILLIAAFFRLYYITDHPAGILSDTAINGIDAWRLMHRSELVPFLFANGGRESLFIYWQSLFVALLGTTNLAVRLPGVLVDIGTVAAVFWLTFWLVRDRWAAIFAGFAAATSFWLVPVSRLGFRAILVPLFSAVAIWLLLWAWQHQRRRWFALAGIAFGLLGYTYLAARVMPLVLLAFLPEMLPTAANRAERRQRWAGLGVFGLAAATVFTPMWLYLRPFTAFSGRTGDVSIWHFAHSPAELMVQLWNNLWRSVGFFCCTGNTKLLIFGMPNQPAFLLGTGIFVLAGVLLALTRLRRLPYRVLALWWAIGLLPGSLAIEAPHPLRLIVSAVPAFILLGIWLAWAAQQAAWIRWVAMLWLAIAAIFGFVEYHLHWAGSSAVAALFNAEKAMQAQTWLADTRAGETVTVPQSALAGYENAPLRFYLLGNLSPHTGKGTSDSAVFSAAESVVRLGEGAMVLLPPADVSSGKIPTHSLAVEIPPLTLISAAFPFVIPADGTLPVTLFWQTAQPLAEDYRIVLQVLDDDRRVWSTDDAAVPTAGVYPPRLWRVRVDTVPDARLLHLKENMPPGRYQLAVAVFDPRLGRRLSLGDGSGDTAFIAPLKVPVRSEIPAGSETVSAEFQGVGILEGISVPQAVISAGEPLSLTLVWRATASPPADYTVFVHLLDAAGKLVGGQDNQPRHNRYPTSIWSPGERIPDPYDIPSAGLPAGEYRLAVGMYNSQTGERVVISGTTNGEVLLPVKVTIGD